MSRYDASDIRKSYSGSLKFIFAVQPLENTVELVSVFHVKAHAVIADEKNLFGCCVI